MTFLNSLALILCLQAVLVMTTIPTSHCNTIKLEDYQPIENICRKTPNYDICIQSLKSIPGSSNADVGGLALIMVTVMKAIATSTLNQIHVLQKGASGPAQMALSSCATYYNAILVGDIPQTIDALRSGDPKLAEDWANDAANEANFCESKFDGHSLLTQENNAMHNVANVTAAIIRNLL